MDYDGTLTILADFLLFDDPGGLGSDIYGGFVGGGCVNDLWYWFLILPLVGAGNWSLAFRRQMDQRLGVDGPIYSCSNHHSFLAS